MRPTSALLCLALLPLLLAACLTPGPVKKDRITAMLEGRRVFFDQDGAETMAEADRGQQVWNADGTTLRSNMGFFGGDVSGRWTTRNDLYCTMLGYQTEWTCYRVTLSDKGRRIRFSEVVDDIGDVIFWRNEYRGTFADAAP
jgi:hypothetical protein